MTEVEPKCKAGNLIWRLAEGSVASSPANFVAWLRPDRVLAVNVD
ncbi:hypothetical protein WN51_03626 [Melipona quadrifasciata]|uniref:Uncharacterized protein n=1 Tax=Melipona quadrifasciata TaxID=166423 RepID=A0A0M8ZTY3_9HYME|nr:hypothetical protein WN51_03626 [Melipona quadrifasciata]